MTLEGVRVLLAEDNPTNQLVAGQMLESLGASVRLARDGAEALEIAECETFDVMLIDIEMPRVGGIEVIRRIRGWSAPCSETPIIVLTAYVMREHRVAIEAAGADGIIAKPIASIEQFGTDVRQLMSRRADDRAVGPETGQPDPRMPERFLDRRTYDALAETIGPSAMAELLDKVEADVTSARHRISKALESGAAEEIREATHILVSVAGAIGATNVQERAKLANAAAQTGANGATEGELGSLLDEIDRMLAFVRKEQRR